MLHQDNHPVVIKTIHKSLFNKMRIQLVLGNAKHIKSYSKMSEKLSGDDWKKMETVILLANNGIVRNRYCLVVQHVDSGEMVGFIIYDLLEKNIAMIRSYGTNKQFDEGGLIEHLLCKEITEQLKLNGFRVGGGESADSNASACDRLFKKHESIVESMKEAPEAIYFSSLKTFNNLPTNIVGIPTQLTNEFDILSKLNLQLINPNLDQFSVAGLFLHIHLMPTSYFTALKTSQNPYKTAKNEFFIQALQDKTTGKIIAAIYYKYSESKKIGSINSHVVLGEFENRGYGSMILLAALKDLLVRGCEKVKLISTRAGAPLYVSFAFLSDGVELSNESDDEYDDEYDDADDEIERISRSEWETYDLEEKVTYLCGRLDNQATLNLKDPLVIKTLNDKVVSVKEKLNREFQKWDLEDKFKLQPFTLYSKHNNFFSNVVNRQKPINKEIVLKTKYSKNITIQEEAATILTLLEEYDKKYKIHFPVLVPVPDDIPYHTKMASLKQIFFNIAYSNPLEGVFEKLSYDQLQLMRLSVDNNLNNYIENLNYYFSPKIGVLQRHFKIIFDSINQFDFEYGDLRELSAYFSYRCNIFSGELKTITVIIQEGIDLIDNKAVQKKYLENSDQTPYALHDQKDILIMAKDEMHKMQLITQKISSNGYSNLTEEQKCEYSQLADKHQLWKKASEVLFIQCKFVFKQSVHTYKDIFKALDQFCDILINAKVVPCKGSIAATRYTYSEAELAPLKLPRSWDISQVKLKKRQRSVADDVERKISPKLA